jgi:outer membrane protein assembly factor BamA
VFWRWFLAFAFAAAAACGGSPRTPVAGQLGAIRIVGNHAIASDALESALALHEAIGDGAAVDPYLLGVDTDRIRAEYLRRGFFAVTVTPVVESRGGQQVVTFTVVEGRRAVSRVEITGLPSDLAPAEARTQVALDDGAPFDYGAYDAAKQTLAARVQGAGYAHARVDGAVTSDPTGAIAIVRYTVEPGPRCAFGKVQIRSPELAPELEAAVRARLPFAAGDRYAPGALATAKADIEAIGRFSAVDVKPDLDGGGPVIDVAVELRPAARHELHAGIGLGLEPLTYELRGLAGGSLVPAAHPLVTAAAETRVAITNPRGASTGGEFEPKLRLLGSLSRTDLGVPRLRGEIEGGADYQTVEAYTWAGLHVRLGLAAPLGPRWLQARIGWLLEGLAFTGIDPLIDPPPDPVRPHAPIPELARMARDHLGLTGSQRLGAYQASLTADLRDDRIDPHRGVYVAVTAAAGTPYAGGELRYLQVTPELRGYLTVGGTVIAIRARAGQILGDVPVTERYFSGGTSGQRGYSERQLAPRVVLTADGCSDTGRGLPGLAASSIVIGGAGLIETGVELRRRIGSIWTIPVGANLFLDGADVTCRASDVDPARLRWAVGVGLWGTFAGLKIHTDVGYRLNRKGADDLSPGSSAFLDDFAWHIGIGETF